VHAAGISTCVPCAPRGGNSIFSEPARRSRAAKEGTRDGDLRRDDANNPLGAPPAGGPRPRNPVSRVTFPIV